MDNDGGDIWPELGSRQLRVRLITQAYHCIPFKDDLRLERRLNGFIAERVDRVRRHVSQQLWEENAHGR